MRKSLRLFTMSFVKLVYRKAYVEGQYTKMERKRLLLVVFLLSYLCVFLSSNVIRLKKQHASIHHSFTIITIDSNDIWCVLLRMRKNVKKKKKQAEAEDARMQPSAS